MKIIAHRGASGYAPENTLKAFRLAVEMGARDHEFDVHRTKDGALVVHHDYDLKRTAGSPASIAALGAPELAAYNAALIFPPTRPSRRCRASRRCWTCSRQGPPS